MKIIAFASFLAAGLAGEAAAASRHRVVAGDHLWGLASRFYGNARRWRVIAEANPGVRDPHWIFPGQLLLIPDLPSEPVEASAPIKAEPEPEEEAAAVEEAAPAAAALPPPAPEKKPAALETVGEGWPEQERAGESLSVDIPVALSGYPSSRIKVSRSWKPAGKVIASNGRESLAAKGDMVNALCAAPAAPGKRFEVYRPASAWESDADQKALYLHRIGLIEAKKRVAGAEHRFLVLQADDSIQSGDLLKDQPAQEKK